MASGVHHGLLFSPLICNELTKLVCAHAVQIVGDMCRRFSYLACSSKHVTDESLVQQTPAPGTSIYQSAELPNGRRVVIHAKFIVIDPEVLLLTSANFSITAEFRPSCP